MDINYKNIWNATSHLWYERALSEHLCMALSPFISILFIKHGVKPNTVTLLMIIFGVIAPLLFMIDNEWTRVIASILFIFWFVLDCSDGEVARFTKTFSKHGADLDYLSHVSCHSLFIMALWKIFAYQSEHILPLTILFFALLSVELFYRLSVIYSVYRNDDQKVEETKIKKRSLKYNILLNLTYFPNFVVIIPGAYCLLKIIGIDILPFILSLFVIYIIVKIKQYVMMVIKFYRS